MASAALERFLQSTRIGYDQWHDGEGYDLDALAELDGDERVEAERFLLARAGNDWRDLEGLRALGTARAREAIIAQLRDGSGEQRLHAARFLRDDPALAADVEAAVVDGLGAAVLYAGLSTALDLASDLRTPAMVGALARACLRDEDEAAVHAAARLAFVRGVAKEPFDWDLRPLFLRFATPDRREREVAFRELCALCGLDPGPYLAG